jgi:DNA-binding beta-propeller fold protein YncE
MLIHSDSPGEAIGFIDISDPTTPTGAGHVEMGGEPTSVVALGAYVFVGVNTSESFVEPGGHVAVVDIATREIVATCDVAGQPDALAVSPDGTYLAVAVENERDEDINDGVIPQLPAGHLAVISLGADGMPSNCNDVVIVGLTGLAAVAPTDPEPEYVDINRDNLAVVTLQENNHIVVVDLASGDIVNHFSAGTVDLDRVDVAEDGVIAPTGRR